MSQDTPAKTRKSSSAAVAPRKRRKRTVVTGAAHDCFTCAKSGSSCDRRRPYCSQCLDQGLDCPGYKTTLTWGVGVASRGKFRGLSLPVSGSQPAAAKPRSTPPSDHLQSQLPHGQPSPASDTLGERASPVDVPSPHAPGASNPLTDLATDFESGSAPGSWTGSLSPSFQSSPTAWPYPSQDIESDEAVSELERRRSSHAYPFLGSHSPSLSQLLLARSVGRTPRLRYLISYYAEVIAPVIVAFDSPTNPFRTSIVRMAQDSTSLQEAIATLSTSNLRQRRERGIVSTGRTEPSRMSSLAHRALTDHSLHECADPFIPEGYPLEEQYHRRMAVQELNKELADPQRRLSDSVLATLLILCLFHVCDTGVAQFKTQFAGVTKLLAIRMRTMPYLSDELRWFIRMFTWYDTMTATTNDRETELHSRYIDLTTASGDEWGLENLAGCDGRLFKVISHLGRLNILSQNQETTETSPHIFIPTTTPPPSMSYYANSSFSKFPAHADPYLFPLPTPPRSSDRIKQPSSPTFWAEWYSIRQQLEAWRFPEERPSHGLPIVSGYDIGQDPSTAHAYISPPSSPLYQCGVAPHNVEDVFHISESFRHSALLYSERLAYPDLPSSHPRIQQIVQRSMVHILSVKSDVYLLWPLFVTGSECVLHEQRVAIEERCKDISKDSGFCNNLSCLELLQHIWEENPPIDPPVHDGGHVVYPHAWSALDEAVSMIPTTISKSQGFRWHQVMQAKRAEGEYMVV
ncbi:Putative Podospora anserina S mat genomic DNA chromosome 2, supercontig 2 [Aspergillus calidoustus]|uniref:Putative Podospora anserina S mat genomic DNA chromosome 2, supercontig 2 n=1 Tax=Aspergillus calidoustus TaxID=454130 RepID=A0A0U5G1T9_ASPCI|nr:Putative Podospora anserina S mat genomic DNA chromosome 2, supercontig 2 [Aspergillus calidoustus]